MPPPKRPAPPPPNDPSDESGATVFVRVGSEEQPPAEEPANDGATAFVTAKDVARGAEPAPRRPAPSAPKKGLQVTLPDGEAQPSPPPKAKPAPAGTPPAVGNKGRRGAWWEEQAAAESDPPAEEPTHDGATAVVNLDDIEEDQDLREPEPEPPPHEPEPEYRPVPAPDYGGHADVESPVRKWVRRAVVLVIAGGVLGAGALVALYFYLSASLPKIESFGDYKPLVSTHVVARDGTLVGEFYKQRRTVVPLDKMPRHLVDAVVSAEDKDFFKHHGVSALGLLRAAVVDILSGRKRQGASTITQQVVKTFFLSGEKKFSRKVKEILLAFRLEKDLPKDDILGLYLNQINFGNAHYGVEEASRYYFNKHVWEIDLGEAAILAGLPQNPARLNPRNHPAKAKTRQTYVLDRMLANKKITQEQRDREVEKPLLLPPAREDLASAWYLSEVKRRLVDQFGEGAVNTAGMTVEVPMDPALQIAADQSVKEGLRAIDKRQGWRGAEFNPGDTLEEVRAALARRYRAMAPVQGATLVFDLGGLPEAEQASADRIARAAKVKTLVPGGIYGGIVVKIDPRGADVELAPDVIGWVPWETMKWARPFAPAHGTPAPKSPRDLVKRGDVVEVMATKVVYRRGAMRGRELELALEQTPAVQGAFIALDMKTREVLALVGGYDAALSQFNRATQAKRQPGSAFKPILYAAAVETGRYTPSTRVDDSPEVIVDPFTGKAWKPENFEKEQFDGPMPLRKALATSKNTVAVKLLLDVGLDRVRAVARAAGLSTEIPRSYTAALGTGEVIPLELVNAYATIGSLGRKGEPVLIRKVRSRDGSLMFQAEGGPEPSLKPEVAYVTADMMRAVIEDPEGTARSLGVLLRPIAGKTGTASEHRDAWFIGFTPSMVAGAWVGFDNHERLGALETGGHAAGPIWLRFMRGALGNSPTEDWPAPPPGVTVAMVNRNTGALATDPNDPFAQKEVFLAGTEPVAAAPTADQTQFLKE